MIRRAHVLVLGRLLALALVVVPVLGPAPASASAADHVDHAPLVPARTPPSAPRPLPAAARSGVTRGAVRRGVHAPAATHHDAVPYRPTSSTAFLQGRGIAFKAYERPYTTAGTSLHAEVKSLVMEDDRGRPFLVLMHGDRNVSLERLAAHLRVRNVRMAKAAKAEDLTGFKIGSIGPFGLRELPEPMPIYVEQSVLDLPSVLVGAGRRGLVIEIDPKELVSAVSAHTVNVATLKE